jgi:hypothetical protein
MRACRFLSPFISWSSGQKCPVVNLKMSKGTHVMEIKHLISGLLSENQKRKLINVVSKQLNISHRVNYQSEFNLPYKILIGTHHKTGTVWLGSIFRAICREYSLNFFSGQQADLPVEYDVFFQNHSRFDLDNLDNTFRGLYMTRDPRDMIISGCLYHLSPKIKEKWLHRPEKDWNGLTYQEMLCNFQTLDEQIHFEMEHSAKNNINDMMKWNYSHSSFFELKYEELIDDTNLILFHRAFSFLGFPASVLPSLLSIAFSNSLFSGQLKKDGHIRSGKTGQWRKYFKQSHKDRFLELFSDVLIRLGYEEDNSWVNSEQME